ncbi:N-acetylmuramidase family protein [Pseudaminobacter arsenicus]|uniref:N-acetylmuramidase family protein n=1 Tax=Borborobacter arsenicus TaxID=1851146 RepID=A0A432V5Z5_9HYPH|nr:N-acetylmuramidase family protein [Pseudaminobacter arsenicus]RUM97503.1 N-acetylmuramidase family protein [Pseudaminobacter arsenicus]
MTFSTETIDEIASAAKALGVEPAALLAIAEVESGGKAFALVSGRREPLIRFEGHYFDRRLSAQKRQQARVQGLASPTAGAVANPATQAARWRLLGRAAAIDHQAAHESASWGIAQVMGAHWRWLGYQDVDALVAEARSGVAGQIRLMMRYIEKSGLTAAINRRDWEGFARGYNGPDYKRGGYDTKIAAAYEKYRARYGGSQTANPTRPETSSDRPALAKPVAGQARPLPQPGSNSDQTIWQRALSYVQALFGMR